jgi:carbon-monoxide dehydrogenase medium subunit
MAEFDYIAPSSLEETLQILYTTSPALLLAGGTRLLPDLRANRIPPTTLIDLRHLDTLKYIRLEDHHLAIGAKTTLAEIEHSQLVQHSLPLLIKMSKSFANPLVRTSATLGGNVASFASPADAVVPLLALDARLSLQTPGGKKWNEQLVSFITTRPYHPPITQEIVTQIRVPVSSKNIFWFYYKLGNRKASATSVASIALVITLKGRSIQNACIASGAITSIPLRATHAEAILLNETLPLSNGVIARCLSALVTDLQEPRDDLWASATYRIMMGQALIKKALQQLNVHAEREHEKTIEDFI